MVGFIKQKWHILIGACIGCFLFLLVYGVTPLDVTNDGWIMAGYDADNQDDDSDSESGDIRDIHKGTKSFIEQMNSEEELLSE